jgi:integrase
MKRNKTRMQGVKVVKGNYYYTPTSRSERAALKAAGLPSTQVLGKDEKEARRKWVELRTARPASAARGTVSEILSTYEAQELDRVDRKTGEYVRAEDTRREYRRQLGLLGKAFGSYLFARDAVEAGNRTVPYLRPPQVAFYLREHKAPVEANRQVALLRAVFGWAREVGLTEYNPAGEIRRNPESPRTTLPTKEEIERLGSEKGMAALMLQFEAITGMRGMDIRQFTKAQVETGSFVVTQHKTGKQQRFALTPGARKIINAALTLRKGVESEYVFCTEQGTAYTKWGYQTVVRRQLKSLGIKATAHDFRALAITLAGRQGKNAQDFAGHSDARLTKRVYDRLPVDVEPTE